MNWCLTHEQATELPVGYEDLTCMVVSSRPPELDPDWIDHVVEPSEEEFIEMDMSAEALEADLEV